MSRALTEPLEARKTPVQVRSALTVEAIAEATIQVLLSAGADRLTTTRVAERAGVSVGTLYQYYPNKQALLFTVLEQHLERVASAVEQACSMSHNQPLARMMQALTPAFIDAKLERADISLALYAVSAELGGPELVKRIGLRSRRAVAAMLQTATDGRIADIAFTANMLIAAMSGTMRVVLEAGATLRMVRQLRKEMARMCESYLRAAAGAAD